MGRAGENVCVRVCASVENGGFRTWVCVWKIGNGGVSAKWGGIDR